jgi:peptide/nickel transport system permease protein
MSTTTVAPAAATAVPADRPGQAWVIPLPRVVRALAGNFVFVRIVKAVFTIWVVTTITFFLIRLMPGNPVDQLVAQLVAQYNTPYVEARAQAAALLSLDLNEPVLNQYADYMRKLLQGNMGNSLLARGTSVSSIILAFLPWTLFTVGVGLLISFTLGIGLGMLMAYRRESLLDHTLSVLGSFLHSIPNYILSLLILVFLGVQWRLLPVTQMRGSLSPGMQPSFSPAFFGDVLFHASLPILAYVLTTIGTWMLTMKASTTSTLEEEYVAFGKAKGLPERRLVTAYVGRNAILPLFTQLTLTMGFIFGGAVLIEAIFVYRGIGGQLFSAVQGRDYPVMQGILLVTTAAVVLANLLADLLYSRIDPRIRLGRSG